MNEMTTDQKAISGSVFVIALTLTLFGLWVDAQWKENDRCQVVSVTFTPDGSSTEIHECDPK